MKIKLAGTLGYCLGVRMAMDTAFRRLSKRGEKVYSHGELIHNPPALALLAKKGLRNWSGENEGTLIIRAHGLPPDELARLAATDLTVCDATCPRVRRVQRLVAAESAQGRRVIIWGKADHPEVVGLKGHAGPEARVVAGPEEITGLPEAESVLLVAQTTQDLSKWPAMEKAVLDRWPEALLRNTICEATFSRQRDVRRLALEVDVLVVIGGKTSGNTARLADIGRAAGKPVVLVESAVDLDPVDFAGRDIVGVAAGASTSTWQIAQILSVLQTLARSRNSFGNFWPRLLRVLVLSSLYAGLGLAFLALTTAVLMGAEPQPVMFSFFFFQSAALHIFRDFFQGRGASRSQISRFNDPDRSAFLDKYSRPLTVYMAVLTGLSIVAAGLAGPGAMAVLGLTWAGALAHQFIPRPQSAREPLARTLLGPALLAAGWGVAMVWAAHPETPWWPLKSGLGPEALLAGGAVFGHIFALGLMGDVQAAQGDRIFGRPTLPTVFGEKATRRLLSGFLVVWAVWLLAGWAFGVLPSLAGWMILTGPVYNLALLRPLFPDPERGDKIMAFYGYHFEALMYGQLLATGLAALFWSLA